MIKILRPPPSFPKRAVKNKTKQTNKQKTNTQYQKKGPYGISDYSCDISPDPLFNAYAG